MVQFVTLPIAYYPPRIADKWNPWKFNTVTAQQFTVVTFHRMQSVGGRPIGTTPRFLVLRRRYCQDYRGRGRCFGNLYRPFLPPDFETREVIRLFQSARKKANEIRVFWRCICFLINWGKMGVFLRTW